MLDLLIQYLNKDVLRQGIIQNYERIKELRECESFHIAIPFSIQINFSRSPHHNNIIVIELTSEDDYSHSKFNEYIHSVNLSESKEELVDGIIRSLERIHYCDYCKSFKVFRKCYLLTDKCIDCYESSMIVIPGNCPICLDPLSEGLPFILECAHAYHQKCIMKVDKGCMMIKCPVCRKRCEFYNWTESFSTVKKGIMFNK